MSFQIITRLTYALLGLSFLFFFLFMSLSTEPRVEEPSGNEIVFRCFPADVSISAKASLSEGNGNEVPLGRAYEPISKSSLKSLGSNFTLVYSRVGFVSESEEFKDPKKLLGMSRYPTENLINLKPKSTQSLVTYKLQTRWPWLASSVVFFLGFVALYLKQQKVNRVSDTLYKVGAQAGKDKYIGTTVNDYTITRHLGKGAWGSVYEAIPTNKIGAKNVEKYHVAVKFYALSGSDDTQENRERFLKEGLALKDLSHRNIVQFIEAGETEDPDPDKRHPFLVLAYVSGYSLDTKTVSDDKQSFEQDGITINAEVRTYFKISPREILDWFRPLAEALDYAHSKNIIHRDLKPANIKITDDGVPVLLDFGLSKLNKSTYTKTGTTMGTPAYAAPESTTDAKLAGPPSDQYSMATMVYHMLSGKHPFGDTEADIWTAQIMHQKIPDALESYDDNVTAVLRKMLAFEPSERYASVGEAFEALEESLGPWL